MEAYIIFLINHDFCFRQQLEISTFVEITLHKAVMGNVCHTKKEHFVNIFYYVELPMRKNKFDVGNGCH